MRDLVGIYAAGPMHSGFANSFGQRNWDTSENFNLDWSFFHDTDKAVKADVRWQRRGISMSSAQKAEASAEQLHGAPPDAAAGSPPGATASISSPAALWELLGVLGWGGFGLRAHRTKTTPLLKMVEAGARLHPGVSLRENTAEGITPRIPGRGLHPSAAGAAHRGRRLPRVPGVAALGARVRRRDQRRVGGRDRRRRSTWPPGACRATDVLAALGTGIYVGNLWYLNFSDRTACRMTGMTRFGTFWVEGGVIQAPLDVMRFDETVYRLLGENLIALTAEREFILDPGSYFHRSTDSARLPGVLVDDFTLTL